VLRFHTPTATAEGNVYIRRAIKIESGAKSALDPDAPVVVKPYIADDLPNLYLAVDNMTTVDSSRIFWDKVIILHGLRRWWDRRGELKGGGQRVSRHYYDVYRLLASEIGRKATGDIEMADDCVRHARMFFNCADLDLASAVPGNFALTPHDGMLAIWNARHFLYQLRSDKTGSRGTAYVTREEGYSGVNHESAAAG
jgi:hypothetical protein